MFRWRSQPRNPFVNDKGSRGRKHGLRGVNGNHASAVAEDTQHCLGGDARTACEVYNLGVRGQPGNTDKIMTGLPVR
jgi:hypothetical protein